MQYEAAAQKKYDHCGGDGGVEWLKVNADKVVHDLTKAWGRRPDRET